VSPALLRDGWRHRRPVAEGGNEAATQVWRTNSEEVLIAIPVHVARTYQRIDPADQFGGRMAACCNPPIEVWLPAGTAMQCGYAMPQPSRCGPVAPPRRINPAKLKQISVGTLASIPSNSHKL
jgi:hypothetical protein